MPLSSGGYALGLIAGSGRGGVTLGYFFGPRLGSIPAPDQIPALRPDRASYVAMFGDLGLINGAWFVVGPLPHFEETDWPTPVFGRQEGSKGRLLSVTYPDHDLDRRPREREISAEEFEGLPKDGLAGAGYVAKRLDRLLPSVRPAPDEADDSSRVENGFEGAPPNEESVSFYLYFPDETKARTASARMEEMGYRVEVRLGADDINWLALGKKPLEDDDSEQAQDDMLSLAEELGGDFDGYER